MPRIQVSEQVKGMVRELAYRKRVYPRLVSTGRMPRREADYQIALAEAVIETLREVERTKECLL